MKEAARLEAAFFLLLADYLPLGFNHER